MKRARVSSSVAVATLAVAIGVAAWGTGVPAAHAAQQEQPAEPSNERIQLEVIVTETSGDSGTAGGAPEGRTWRVRALTTVGNQVRIRGSASDVGATPVLLGDGRVAVSLSVRVFRTSSNRASEVALRCERQRRSRGRRADGRGGSRQSRERQRGRRGGHRDRARPPGQPARGRVTGTAPGRWGGPPAACAGACGAGAESRPLIGSGGRWAMISTRRRSILRGPSGAA